ncbi:MAG TPA: hypothetical protein VGR28_02805 [Candidatus Thermoplasmatota archaeon]|jgi:hypothetical protein|nr:hypothetical protein [Candidatus Thermoplasmatota archaeon]
MTTMDQEPGWDDDLLNELARTAGVDARTIREHVLYLMRNLEPTFVNA